MCDLPRMQQDAPDFLRAFARRPTSVAATPAQVGMHWGQVLVALGACLGIITGVLVNLLG